MVDKLKKKQNSRNAIIFLMFFFIDRGIERYDYILKLSWKSLCY